MPPLQTEQQRDRGHTASRGGRHLTPGLQPCACCPDSQTHLPQETGSEPCCWGHQTKARRLCSHARPVWGAVQRTPSGLPGGKGSSWCLWPRAAPAAPGAAPPFPTCDPSRPLAGGPPSGACCRASLASVQPPGPPCAGPGTEQLPSRQDLPGCRSRLRGAAASSAPGAGAAPGARAWPAFYFSCCLQGATQLSHSANQGPITTHREERLKLGCSRDLVRHSRPRTQNQFHSAGVASGRLESGPEDTVLPGPGLPGTGAEGCPELVCLAWVVAPPLESSNSPGEGGLPEHSCSSP